MTNYQVVKIQADCVKGTIKTLIANKLSLSEAMCLVHNRNAYASRDNRFKLEEMTK